MPLKLKADDKMPWGKYIGLTLREVYKEDSEYLDYLIKRNWEYDISEKTIDIIRKNKPDRETTQPSFSKGGCLGRTELFENTRLTKRGPFQGSTLHDVFFDNESYYRALLNDRNLFISEKTYISLMTQKYGADSVKKKSRKEVNEEILNGINGFHFKKNEIITEAVDENFDRYIKAYGKENGDIDFSDDLYDLISDDMENDYLGLEKSLREVMGPNAEYREGQKEAILAILNGRRTLVVQRTGWGKSLVYFMSIKKLREQGRGPAIIISPLLALMHNQITSTKKYNLNVRNIASDNKAEWKEIFEELENDEIDALIISPERLADDSFYFNLIDNYIKNISLFVVDEAHCISDWGHDFRPDYCRIKGVVNKLNPATPVLATTATANRRVIEDIYVQLGRDIEITRGTMERKSLNIDVIELESDDEKCLWLQHNIPRFSGVGIVYCLTIRACEEVVVYLRTHGINAEIYHGELDPKDKKDIENEFQENKIKVLVATIAFGMGIDKPDIQFVIHYHQPASAVAYYQQIGRAGRDIPNAYAILLVGDDDNEINGYFIKNAFPTENQMNGVIDAIEKKPGITRKELMELLNEGQDRMDKILKRLLVDWYISKKSTKNGTGYFRTDREWTCDMSRARIVSWHRWRELHRFNEYIETKECYMSFLRKELDDENVKPCGRCANCLGHHLLEE